ncbi:MAG: 4-hydroxy-tetrahydrodipicolinate synthase [Peptostreptococcales bacterium]
MSLFKGCGVAIVTPFKDGIVDKESMGKLLEWHVAEGTDAIIVCGTTGEASTMPDDEHLDTIKFVVDTIDGRIPVIAGTGGNDTRHSIDLSVEAEKLGADGLLHVTPYYNKASQKGLIKHYTAIADSVNIPIILYNVPGRTGVNLLPSTVLELSKHKNIKGLKEASGIIAQVVEVARLMPDDFYLYSGNDEMVVPLMSVGGAGVISTVANIVPKEMHDMANHFLKGDIKKAAELQLKLKPLIDAMFVEVNPMPIKVAVSLMHHCSSEVRLPLCELEDSSLEKVKKTMTTYGLI